MAHEVPADHALLPDSFAPSSTGKCITSKEIPNQCEAHYKISTVDVGGVKSSDIALLQVIASISTPHVIFFVTVSSPLRPNPTARLLAERQHIGLDPSAS